MKKLNLKGVKVRSFVTKLDENTGKAVKGAGTTDTEEIEICMFTRNNQFCHTYTGDSDFLWCTAPK